MITLIVGITVVIGACIALWWHHRRFRALMAGESEEHARAFAGAQFNRRTLTTTMIGVLGLLIMASEIVDSKWGDLFILLGMTVLLLIIPLMALLDFQATQRYFRSNDQGVKRATKDLVEELKRIEQRLREKKAKEQESSEQEAGEKSQVNTETESGNARGPDDSKQDAS